MPRQNDEHTKLVRDALEALALGGYTAWPNNTGALPTESGGFLKFGKKGSADIMGIMPPYGRHFECEAKTGNARQNKNQERHQKYVVERNGGIYILFHSVAELLQKLECYRNPNPETTP